MNKIKYISLLLAVAIAVLSCERDLEIPLPEHTPKLVINGYLKAGKPIEIYVTRSYSIVEKVEVNDILVPNATVLLLEGDIIRDTLSYRDTTIVDSFFTQKTVKLGKYYSETIKAESGKSYTVRVSHDKYGTATASTTIPPTPKVTDAKIDQDVYLSLYTDFDGQVYAYGQSMVKVKIDDPAGQKNFYDFEVAIDYESPNFPGQPFFSPLYTRNNTYRDPEGGYYGDEKPFTDEGFDGTIKTLDLVTELPDNYTLLSERKALTIQKIYVKAISVNEDYYRFKNKFDLQLQNRDVDDFGIIPTEAIVVYSNVEGGFGVLAGFNEAVFEF
ncbi:MAG: DUF4249 domain-containing protein [Bacteroidia bacterium]|nr:DUF4249 domain-containing protein [Bacteroidia bacterium]